MSTDLSTRIAAGVTAAYVHDLARRSTGGGGEPRRPGAGLPVRRPVGAVPGRGDGEPAAGPADLGGEVRFSIPPGAAQGDRVVLHRAGAAVIEHA